MYCIYVNYINIMNDKNDNWKYRLMETFADNFLIVKRGSLLKTIISKL